MIENYKLNEYGIIEQIKRKPFAYGYDYSNNYNNLIYKENSIILNIARLTFCITNYKFAFPEKEIISILDIGYGNGDFLNQCIKMIPECYGYDVSNYKLNEPIKIVNNMFDRHYDIITFWDSLEHFYNIDFINKLNCNMICISMPYCHWKSDKDDQWFYNWKHRKPDEHLYHFNPKSLNNFMSKQNYECVTYSSNIEELVRKNKPNEQNIFSASYKKLY